MRRRESGSSLLEVLVVIVVFGVGILGVVQIFPKALNILRDAREGSIAESLAQQKIQQIKSQKWQWSSLPMDQVKKGFWFDPGKKKINFLDWRKYLNLQVQSIITEELVPNNEGLIFCSNIPLANTPKLFSEQSVELNKVSEELDLSSDTYYEPKETEGLGIYKIKQDQIKKRIKVSYNVSDWRTLSEDFLGVRSSQYQLMGQSIKKCKDLERDNQIYSGFSKEKDFILINLLNGKIIGKNRYDLDYPKGVIKIYTLNSDNIPVRAYYQKKGEWYLQILRIESKQNQMGLIEKWIVRVYWNPYFFRLKGDDEAKINAINKWADQYKMIELEAF